MEFRPGPTALGPMPGWGQAAHAHPAGLARAAAPHMNALFHLFKAVVLFMRRYGHEQHHLVLFMIVLSALLGHALEICYDELPSALLENFFGMLETRPQIPGFLLANLVFRGFGVKFL